MPQITRQQLIDHKACQTQVDLFSELFGESVEVTVDACLAVAGRFNFDWAARNLLSSSTRTEYDRARASALAEYDRAIASAWADYEQVRDYALARRVRDGVLVEYSQVCAPARIEYDRVCARAFAEAYLNQETSRASNL